MEAAIQFDPATFKAAMREQWDQSAPGWNDHTAALRTWLGRATGAMLDMAGIGPGDRVLDVAAGAGDQTLDIARRVGPEGRVLATDISPAILALAQDNARRAGLAQVEVQVSDGEALDLEAASFDAAVSRLGLMFFPDPLQGLRQMHRALRPGGGVAVLVFGEPAANPCVSRLLATALRHAGLPPRDPHQPGSLFSLGRPGRLDELFSEAGFSQVASTRLAAPFEMPSAAHYLRFIRSSASPIQQILSRLDVPAQQAAWDDMERQLHAFDTAQGWSGPNELVLTAGRA
ncbi:class I SAM-dependent methyltransferase [Ramlibacter sp. AW1]|uniref:Class I SAM-dependent methyltransferase n=1 Tax=Ramlibacter aurantiacus TaxID=2801330 RepID=A0A937D5Q8_9BURK|nr:class I SAM-dependent methyltransferase [Ramlibacter aurantiacus]MBL0421567.1 class I SAM-dependent methyltransferase [Ramlibacter aurantiacus]